MATSRPAVPPGSRPVAAAARLGSTGGIGAAGTGGSAGSAGAGGNPYPAPTATPADEDGSQLWLRYPKVNLPARLAEYQAGITQIVTAGSSATCRPPRPSWSRG